MSAVGLTKAMRRALENLDGDRRMMERLCELCLIAWNNDGWHRTPRGQAARAAPTSITAMQLQVLEWLEVGEEILTTHINSFTACCRKGWVNEDGSDLSDAGTTALNNVRAASGSAEWKEAK